MSKSLKIGLIGFGNIGTGVVRHLAEQGELINSRLPRPLELVAICDRDLKTERGVDVSAIKLTTDFADIIGDPAIDVVIELVGGTKIAHEIVTSALRAGKHVVTANKALVATFGGELFQLAHENNVHLLFEASVGAGIPLIRTFQTSLLPNRFTLLTGILNGTCNYILSAMNDNPGQSFEPILVEAQNLGYAEPDPTLDIEGIDAAHKIAIMGSLAFGRDLRIDDVTVQGITRIDSGDFAFAHANNQTIKLLATAELDDKDGVHLSVWPTFVPRDRIIASVNGVTNTLWVEAEPVGGTMYAGAGAGQGSTSSGVVSDLCVISQAGDNETLKRLNPISVAPDAPRGGAPAKHPRRYLRVRTENPDELIGALDLPVLHRGMDSVAFVAPAQKPMARKALLEDIQRIGYPEKDICEIRVGLQDESVLLDQAQ